MAIKVAIKDTQTNSFLSVEGSRPVLSSAPYVWTAVSATSEQLQSNEYTTAFRSGDGQYLFAQPVQNTPVILLPDSSTQFTPSGPNLDGLGAPLSAYGNPRLWLHSANAHIILTDDQNANGWLVSEMD